MVLGNLFQIGIVLGMKDYLQGFFLQDNWISLQWWWSLIDVVIGGRVCWWYGISARLQTFCKTCVS